MTDQSAVDEQTTLDQQTAAPEEEAAPEEAAEADATEAVELTEAADVTAEAAEAPGKTPRAARSRSRRQAAPEAASVEAAEETVSAAAESEAAVAEPETAQAAPAAGRARGTRAAAAAVAGSNNGLRARYQSDVVPALQKEFGYSNPNQVPRVSKIIVNIGLGEALQNAKALDAAVGDLATITGQKPIVTRARRSIAQFRLRTGNPIGAKVTLRGQYMWDFLERLTRLALPRIRDFRGVPSKSFDGRGNYSLGLREQLAFPEIDYDKIDRLRGLEVSIVTTAKTDEESKRLLQLLGMPFSN